MAQCGLVLRPVSASLHCPPPVRCLGPRAASGNCPPRRRPQLQQVVESSSALPLQTTVAPLETVPQLKDAYRIGQQVGRGSFALVLEVVDQRTGTRLCAKRLPKFTNSRLPCQQSQVVAAEVDAQRALCSASTSILRLYDVRQDDSYFYLISELCQSDLGRYLVDHDLVLVSERTAAHIIQQLLTALQACHNHGVAYRDVKPGNLLVRGTSADGLPEICLGDFGCSRFMHGPRPNNRTSPGTPLFSAPECVQGYAGTESDIWSAGVLLYNLLSGTFPFCDPNQRISQAEYWRRVADAPISFSGPGWRHVSPRAVQLVKRMLERNCNKRITAQEALQDSWLCDLTSSNRTSATWDGAAAKAALARDHVYANVVPGMTLPKFQGSAA